MTEKEFDRGKVDKATEERGRDESNNRTQERESTMLEMRY